MTYHDIKNEYNDVGTKYAAYFAKPHAFTEEDRNHFQSLIKPNATLLDVGCGPGFDARFFCEKGFKDTGIDFSETMISLAARNAPSAKFIQTDIQHLDQIKIRFDAIWSSFSFLHINQSDAAGILAQFKAVLNKDGLIYICIRTQAKTEWHKTKICELDASKENFLETYIQEWNKEEFMALIKASGLILTKQRIFDRPGGTHPFLSVIVKK